MRDLSEETFISVHRHLCLKLRIAIKLTVTNRLGAKNLKNAGCPNCSETPSLPRLKNCTSPKAGAFLPG